MMNDEKKRRLHSNSLLILPSELIAWIFSYLWDRDKVRIMPSLCKVIREMFYENPIVWNKIIRSLKCLCDHLHFLPGNKLEQGVLNHKHVDLLPKKFKILSDIKVIYIDLEVSADNLFYLFGRRKDIFKNLDTLCYTDHKLGYPSHSITKTDGFKKLFGSLTKCENNISACNYMFKDGEINIITHYICVYCLSYIEEQAGGNCNLCNRKFCDNCKEKIILEGFCIGCVNTFDNCHKCQKKIPMYYQNKLIGSFYGRTKRLPCIQCMKPVCNSCSGGCEYCQSRQCSDHPFKIFKCTCCHEDLNCINCAFLTCNHCKHSCCLRCSYLPDCKLKTSIARVYCENCVNLLKREYERTWRQLRKYLLL